MNGEKKCEYFRFRVCTVTQYMFTHVTYCFNFHNYAFLRCVFYFLMNKKMSMFWYVNYKNHLKHFLLKNHIYIFGLLRAHQIN